MSWKKFITPITVALLLSSCSGHQSYRNKPSTRIDSIKFKLSDSELCNCSHIKKGDILQIHLQYNNRVANEGKFYSILEKVVVRNKCIGLYGYKSWKWGGAQPGKPYHPVLVTSEGVFLYSEDIEKATRAFDIFISLHQELFSDKEIETIRYYFLRENFLLPDL